MHMQVQTPQTTVPSVILSRGRVHRTPLGAAEHITPHSSALPPIMQPPLSAMPTLSRLRDSRSVWHWQVWVWVCSKIPGACPRSSLLFIKHHTFIDCSRSQLLLHDEIRFGEVQYYFQMDFNAERFDGDNNSDSESSHSSTHSLALIKLYSRPDEELLRKSSTALSVCHLEDDKFLVVPLTQVKAVVGMVPFNPPRGCVHAGRDEYFVVEKMGHSNKFYEDDDGNIDVESDVDADVD